MRHLIFAVVIPLFILTACSSEPKTYEDCVFRYVPDAKTKAAAMYLRKACETKFKKKTVQATGSKSGSRTAKETQIIHVEGIGDIEFPSDMGDAAVVEAIHRNFPELGPNS